MSSALFCFVWEVTIFWAVSKNGWRVWEHLNVRFTYKASTTQDSNREVSVPARSKFLSFSHPPLSKTPSRTKDPTGTLPVP